MAMSSSSPHAQSAPPSGNCPDWILLDTLVSGAEYRWGSLASSPPALASSATTAKASVKLENDDAEVSVEVSFQFFEPPDVSTFFVRSRGVRDDGMPYHACVVGAEGNLVLLYIVLDRYEPGLFYVYRASRMSPSLEVLPRPSGSFNPTKSVGILPLACGGYLVAASACPQFLEGVLKCQLFLFSSETKAWSTKLAPLLCDCDTDFDAVRDHKTDKVISVGRDSLGWVDLWEGILVCNLLTEEEPFMSFIELPDPMPGNEDHFGTTSARSCRDVICVGNLIKFVEVDFHQHEYGVTLGITDTDYGWKAKSWSRMLTSKDWHACFAVDTDEIPFTKEVRSHLFPDPWDEKLEKPSLNELICSAPTLSIENGVLYMMSKLDFDPKNPVAWLAVVDMGKNSLELVSITAERTSRCHMTHLPCAFSKFLR